MAKVCFSLPGRVSKKGYFNNRFEVETRLSENREAHVYDVEFV